LINSLNGCNKDEIIEIQLDSFLRDTRGIDTIAMKMVFYLAITGTILLLVTVSWGNISPYFDRSSTDEQIKDAAIELLSIQNGYARDLRDSAAIQGSTCTIELSLSENIKYLALGIDPDPDSNGNLTDSTWKMENNTILIQYRNGEKNRFLISGEDIRFRNGIVDHNDKWNLNYSEKNIVQGIVIEEPVNGEFVFELIQDTNGKYTLSHF